MASTLNTFWVDHVSSQAHVICFSITKVVFLTGTVALHTQFFYLDQDWVPDTAQRPYLNSISMC